MKIQFEHGDTPCELITSNEHPWINLDLGHSLNHMEPAGPRVACRRTDDGKGWRIQLHADGNEAFYACEIPDAPDGIEPVVTVIESC